MKISSLCFFAIASLLLTSCGVVLPPSSISQNKNYTKHAIYNIDQDKPSRMLSLDFTATDEDDLDQGIQYNGPTYFRSMGTAYTYSRANTWYSYAFGVKLANGYSKIVNDIYYFSNLDTRMSYSLDLNIGAFYMKIVKITMSNTFHFGSYENALEYHYLIPGLNSSVDSEVWPHRTPIQQMIFGSELGVLFGPDSALSFEYSVGRSSNWFDPLDPQYVHFNTAIGFLHHNKYYFELGATMSTYSKSYSGTYFTVSYKF